TTAARVRSALAPAIGRGVPAGSYTVRQASRAKERPGGVDRALGETDPWGMGRYVDLLDHYNVPHIIRTRKRKLPKKSTAP
ncbi:unnamed protein product, partial [marine sediment metagenome]